MINPLKTIQVLAKVGKIISTIAFVCSIVGAVFCVVGITSLAVGAEGALRFGGVNIYGIIEKNTDISVGSMYASMAAGVYSCAAGAVLAAFAKRYFQREMDAGTPFTNAGADEIFRLGILTIVLPLAARLLSEITNGVLREAMDGAGKLAVDNGGAVGMGIAFLVMSVIFRYGAQLEEKTK